MAITQSDVEQVALLARLALSEDEKRLFAGQLNAILTYVGTLNELMTDDILPMAHAVPMENAFRHDEVVPPLGTEAALINAPERVEGFFRVPKVIE
jgi:aspartyl-tRNA(Asn)/glutamyl-tRNA(Gln) amidotransferase subunit C